MRRGAGKSIVEMSHAHAEKASQQAWSRGGVPNALQEGALIYGAGDRTENVLLRLLPKAQGGFGHLDDRRIQPEIIVFMLGINNVSKPEGDVVAKVVAGDMAAVRRLRALRPNAHILVQSVLPTNHPGDIDNYVRPINARLAQEVRALGPGYSWLDLYPDFVLPNGEQNEALFRDGYHLTLQGYQVWRSKLLPVLDEIRAERRHGERGGRAR